MNSNYENFEERINEIYNILKVARNTIKDIKRWKTHKGKVNRHEE